ncbi:glycosylphosphatidylinositol anchor biosynthesis [Sporothrix stenoceras]|uniref:Glycosylphosphatidylinositol anchor biosynthesis n=1 Tax=Sporothrix stenoceras TaxID=5173 RepID=A0ABR3Z2I9_9PEZI
MATADAAVFSLPPGRPNGQAPAAQATSSLKPSQAAAPSSTTTTTTPSSHLTGQPAALPALTTDFDGPFPALTRSSTLPASLRSVTSTSKPLNGGPTSATTSRRADPYHLAPEDAFYTSVSPPWDRNAARNNASSSTAAGNTSNASGSELPHEGRLGARQSLRPGGLSSSNLRRSASGVMNALNGSGEPRSRSRRRRRRTWKKLLWVKQSYPDNYTDQATFLENLQRNPRLQPYDFWPLVADSTVIVQHVCSVIVFVICFVGIAQDRVSPVSVVGWGSIATGMGWVLWEWWAGQEQQERRSEGFEDDDFGGGGIGPPLSRSDLVDGFPSLNGQRISRRYREPNGNGTDNGNGGATSAMSATSATSADQSPPTSSLAQHSAPSSRLSKHSTASTVETMPSLAASTNSSTTSLLNMSNRHGRVASGKANVCANGNGSTGTGRSTGASTSSSWQPVGHHSSLSQVSTGSNTTNGPTSAHRPASSHGRSAAGYIQVPTTPATPRYPPPRRSLTPLRGGRGHHRIATIKSAVLIYFTLLGLSPILKSLTRSTSSDSIWAMSFWLLAINIFFFDYSGVWVGAHKFPVASLSTNAALMASTVLASRLPSTGQVFSLTLFSIEVFGLFPVFRRYARHRSWQYHVGLTVLLVLGAGAGVGIILTEPGEGLPWRGATAGMVVACLLSAVAMGGCSWWLIGLQKYKNEIYGPWDPARPVIISRRHWNDV